MAEPQAAVAIVHARAEDSALLIRRAERDGDPWSGHWSLPGGRCDPGDCDAVETALRELDEECGIRLDRGTLETALPLMHARRPDPPYLVVAPFVFRVERELPAAVDFREAVAARWVPLAALRDPARHSLRAIPGRPPAMRFPAIELDAMPLWGFTYRLMTEWLKVTPGPGAAFAAADRVLGLLLDRGLPQVQSWTARGPATIAEVRGTIPDSDVLEHFCVPGPEVPAVNLLEARPDYVRLVGVAFEEYLIIAQPTAATRRT